MSSHHAFITGFHTYADYGDGNLPCATVLKWQRGLCSDPDAQGWTSRACRKESYTDVRVLLHPPRFLKLEDAPGDAAGIGFIALVKGADDSQQYLLGRHLFMLMSTWCTFNEMPR